jgi:hypothetical protein
VDELVSFLKCSQKRTARRGCSRRGVRPPLPATDEAFAQLWRDILPFVEQTDAYLAAFRQALMASHFQNV